jgi:hypothetical protein
VTLVVGDGRGGALACGFAPPEVQAVARHTAAASAAHPLDTRKVKHARVNP